MSLFNVTGIETQGNKEMQNIKGDYSVACWKEDGKWKRGVAEWFASDEDFDSKIGFESIGRRWFIGDTIEQAVWLMNEYIDENI